jgi:hypothetical protein
VRQHDVVAGEALIEVGGDGVGELRRAAQAERLCERAEPDAERGEGDEADEGAGDDRRDPDRSGERALVERVRERRGREPDHRPEESTAQRAAPATARRRRAAERLSHRASSRSRSESPLIKATSQVTRWS